MRPYANVLTRSHVGAWGRAMAKCIDGVNPPSKAGLRDSAASAQQQFALLVQEHHASLYRFVLRRVGCAEDAAEIVQQAFYEAYRGRASFQGGAALSTWLYGIALNLIRNHHARVLPRRRQAVPEAVLVQRPCEAPGPEDDTLRRDRMRRLAAGLADLAPEFREVFVLINLEDRSYEEAAAQLGVPVGTIRSRLFRARAQLRMAIDPD